VLSSSRIDYAQGTLSAARLEVAALRGHMRIALIASLLWIVQVSAPGATLAGAGQNTAAGEFGPEIQFDTRGVEFGPWIGRFMAQIKRNWFIPCAALTETGHTVITFNVQKDGNIADVTVQIPSRTRVFNENARVAILASSPTLPLPTDYPERQAFLTATFYYNELPPNVSPSANASSNRRAATASACSLLGAKASDVEARLGKPTDTDVDGLRWTYRTSAGILAVYFDDDAQIVIDVQPPGFDLNIFKK
jgi:TonB family protein